MQTKDNFEEKKEKIDKYGKQADRKEERKKK
jgi:hypothetical protein